MSNNYEMSTPTITSQKSGVIDAGLILVLVLCGALGFVFFKPSKAQTQAAASVVATANVDSAAKAQSAAAAGSVAAIQQVNSQAPDSPQKNAIAREIPTVLAKLEPPDLKAQNEALLRMNAVIQGKLDYADSLYREEAKLTAKQAAELAKARAERQAVDLALSEAAAVGKFKDQLLMGAGLIIALVSGLWVYTKLFSINPATMGKILSDIRAGTPATQAFDTALAPWHHKPVQTAARLATPSE